MLWITESGIGSGLKRRIDRRVRRKLCRSGVGIKMGWFDLENDSSLSLSICPGFVIVLERELIDMLICTFSSITNNITAHAKIAIEILRILQGHGYFGTGLHILVFDASFVGVDENIFAVGIEPNRC